MCITDAKATLHYNPDLMPIIPPQPTYNVECTVSTWDKDAFDQYVNPVTGALYPAQCGKVTSSTTWEYKSDSLDNALSYCEDLEDNEQWRRLNGESPHDTRYLYHYSFEVKRLGKPLFSLCGGHWVAIEDDPFEPYESPHVDDEELYEPQLTNDDGEVYEHFWEDPAYPAI